MFFFFFQAEDGIRDLTVTGVQTCALPISQDDLDDALAVIQEFDPIGVGSRDLRECLFLQLKAFDPRSEEHTSELQSQSNLVCRLLLEKQNSRTLALVMAFARLAMVTILGL